MLKFETMSHSVLGKRIKAFDYPSKEVGIKTCKYGCYYKKVFSKVFPLTYFLALPFKFNRRVPYEKYGKRRFLRNTTFKNWKANKDRNYILKRFKTILIARSFQQANKIIVFCIKCFQILSYWKRQNFILFKNIWHPCNGLGKGFMQDNT